MIQRFNYDKFSKAIKTKRIIEDNIGVREVAKKMKVSAATISRMENKKEPTLANFIKVCNWLNVTPTEFIGVYKK